MHYNYFRDYDPAIGRYIEYDPLLIHGRLAGTSFALPLASIIYETRLIGGYAYTFNNSLTYSDWSGLKPGGPISSLWDIIDRVRCSYYTRKLLEKKPECERECSPDVSTEKWLEFHRKYGHGEGYRGEAIWDCACERAGQDVCKKWDDACATNPMYLPLPRRKER